MRSKQRLPHARRLGNASSAVADRTDRSGTTSAAEPTVPRVLIRSYKDMDEHSRLVVAFESAFSTPLVFVCTWAIFWW